MGSLPEENPSNPALAGRGGTKINPKDIIDLTSLLDQTNYHWQIIETRQRRCSLFSFVQIIENNLITVHF